jgi:hypothetical protein
MAPRPVPAYFALIQTAKTNRLEPYINLCCDGQEVGIK